MKILQSLGICSPLWSYAKRCKDATSSKGIATVTRALLLVAKDATSNKGIGITTSSKKLLIAMASNLNMSNKRQDVSFKFVFD